MSETDSPNVHGDQAPIVAWLRSFPAPAMQPGDVLLDEPAAAEFLRIGPRTMQRHRDAGTGPRFVRVGRRRLFYRLSDLRLWLDQQADGGHARAA